MKKILIGMGLCSSKEYCLNEVMRKLKELVIPNGFEAEILFVVNSYDQEFKDKIKDFLFGVDSIKYNLIEFDPIGSFLDIIINMRNNVIDFAKMSGADYTLMLDADIGVEPDTLVKLWHHMSDNQLHMISANYATVQDNLGAIPAAFMKKADYDYCGIKKEDCYGVLKVDAVGLGCVLVDKQTYHIGFSYEEDEGETKLSEDFSWCEELKKNHIDVWFDSENNVKHYLKRD